MEQRHRQTLQTRLRATSSTDDEFLETDRPGFRRRVFNGDDLQLCFWRITGGATGSFLHHHARTSSSAS